VHQQPPQPTRDATDGTTDHHAHHLSPSQLRRRRPVVINHQNQDDDERRPQFLLSLLPIHHKIIQVGTSKFIIISNMVLLSLSRSALRQSSASIKKSFFNHGTVAARSMSTAVSSPWADFEMAPPDPIVGLNESFQLDDFPNKVIVGVGAYRDDKGKPYVLPCVREAEKLMMAQGLDMEYAGIVSESAAGGVAAVWLVKRGSHLLPHLIALHCVLILFFCS
jgi:hypothetical protein